MVVSILDEVPTLPDSYGMEHGVPYFKTIIVSIRPSPEKDQPQSLGIINPVAGLRGS